MRKYTKAVVGIIFCGFMAHHVLAATNTFTPKPGDLLFQDLNCGKLCDGIGEVTYGVNKTYMSHVGMVVSSTPKGSMVIEAGSNGVVITPLQKFLATSLDGDHHSRTLVERLQPQYANLIPGAIKYAKQQLGKPYNAAFAPNSGQSYYCSQLIYKAFRYSDHGTSIFHTHHMSFKDPKTGVITKSWQEYFDKLHASAPEGMIGTNPGMLSRESALVLVYSYGNLRVH